MCCFYHIVYEFVMFCGRSNIQMWLKGKGIFEKEKELDFLCFWRVRPCFSVVVCVFESLIVELLINFPSSFS